MQKKLIDATWFCALSLQLLGCAENNTQQQSQQPKQDTVEVVKTQAQPLPSWESHIEPYGFVSSEGAQRFYTNAKEQFGESHEDAGDYYDILGAGDCCWYCGDNDPRSTTASSTLLDQKRNSYKADNAHDLRYDTAWVEGVDGPGLGQTLTYTFDNKYPRITKILIHNGYIKDETTWIKNNRVRALELSINGKPTAQLQLADTRAEQSFDLQALGLEPLGRRADGKDLILTFKILAVYPGTEHDDTAISEIFFDGIDVH